MSRITGVLREKIRQEAKGRCGYCRMPQGIVSMPFEIDHIVPQAAGGSDDEQNLWLACRNCNGFKHSKSKAVDPETNQTVSIFNPRTQVWKEHFEFSNDGTHIIGENKLR